MNSSPTGTLQEDLTLLTPPAADASGGGPGSYLVLVVAGVVVFALTVWLIRLRGRRNRSPVVEKSVRPDLVALEELAVCKAKLDDRVLRDAVASVSGILRRYVAARFGIQAPFLTSEEFWREQLARRAIPEDFDFFWVNFLAAGDMVKYAGRKPGMEEVEKLLESANEFVRESADVSSGATSHD